MELCWAGRASSNDLGGGDGCRWQLGDCNDPGDEGQQPSLSLWRGCAEPRW
jgi:hypothetical protein